MKQLFTISALVALSLNSYAQGTINGMVMTMSSGTAMPAYNQEVHIVFDSVASFHPPVAILYAGVSGNFMYTIPNGIPMNHHFSAVTIDTCNQQQAISGMTYTGASTAYTPGFTVCLPQIPSGTITLGNTGMVAPNAKVYYIKKCFDNVLNAYTLTAIDSTVTSANGAFTMNTMPSASGGCTFFLKAALQTGASNYSDYLPTYYTSSLNWSTASAIPFPHHGRQNFALTAGNNTGGPAFIGGSVLVGANKGTAVGDPLNKRILILTDQTDHPVAYTYSDVNGAFSFGYIAYGTYKIFGDAAGKLNPKLTVTVNAATPAVYNIIFEENNVKFEGHLNATSVGSIPAALSGVTIYPNPATDKVNVDGLDAIQGNKTVTLVNAMGMTVFHKLYPVNAKIVVPVDALPVGFYLVQVTTEAGTAAYKIRK